MKAFRCVVLAVLCTCSSLWAAVTVSTPANGAKVTSPVKYVATATAPTCAKGVASMGIYVNNKLIYVVSGSSLNTSMTLAAGAQHTVVEEWDHCGGATYTTINLTVVASTPSAPTVNISANPTSIVAGKSSILTIAATNATQVTVAGSNGTSYTLAATGGMVTVTPVASTTYTATASGTGSNATAMATVTVTAPSAPSVSIAANPTSIVAGKSSVLTVAAANATQVVVSGSNGTSYTLAATGGMVTVTPATTTSYTATASGTSSNATAMATVTVTAPSAPSVSIAANPTSIVAGKSSVLTVAAANATQVTVSGSDGSSYTLAATGGMVTVTPTATTTYTATASATGTPMATATAIVTVTQPAAPSASIAASPTSIVSGKSSVLTVTAANAKQVTVSGSDGSSYTLAATGGMVTVTPTATTTYTATASATGTPTATATAIVTVTQPAAPTVSIAASPTSIVSGKSSVLTVTAANATQVTVSGSDGTSYTLAATGGMVTVTPTATTTYTATASATGTPTTTATAIVTVTQPAAPTVSISASPASVLAGSASTLTVTAANATMVTVAGTDGSSYTLSATGGTQSVSPTATTTYKATASGSSQSATASTTVTVTPAVGVSSIKHVLFMMQENHSFDNYFGMLNPYRHANGYNIGDDGNDYEVDGIDDKLTTLSNVDDEGTSFSPFKLISTCVDDMSSAWLESYGDVNRYNFLSTRPILMDGFVHDAEGYAKSCAAGAKCSGAYTDLAGQRAMGYYDQGFLNYYYYMASQFAVSNRWFSPISSKSVPNRIATMAGGTTQGLVYDPGNDDHLSQLSIANIFQELDTAKVSWKIYYTITDGDCLSEDDCSGAASNYYPATTFSYFTYSYRYIYENPTGAACTGTTQPSSVVGDPTSSFCIDTNHIAPLSTYFSDLANGTLPSYGFIEAGYTLNDEHPGSGQSVITGQYQVSNILNSFMTSSSWPDSVFFLSYDEGGGPYDHVPPVPGHSNDNTDAALGTIPDIASIAVNPDGYSPCMPPEVISPTTGLPVPGMATTHCDLGASDPGANAGDAPAVQGFAAQLGFRLPNMVISPFTRRHYVSNIPMDHTAVIKFVENRFIGSSTHLTARDAAQPNLLDFFDFNAIPWANPPVPPAPVTKITLGYNPCTPTTMGP